MRVLFLTIFLFLASVPSYANNSIKGTIVEYGVYKPVGNLDVHAAYGTAAKQSMFGTFELVEVTDKVKMAKGVAFGFSWSASGFPSSDSISVTHLLEHPELVTPAGEIVGESRETYFYKSVNGKIAHTEGYMFSEDYELVPGRYKFSVIYKDEVILEKEFLVTNN